MKLKTLLFLTLAIFLFGSAVTQLAPTPEAAAEQTCSDSNECDGFCVQKSETEGICVSKEDFTGCQKIFEGGETFLACS